MGGRMKNEHATFAERVRQLRKESGLTQTQLADYIGVSQATVGNWETGVREVPRGDNLIKLAEAFGLKPEEFMKTRRKGAHGSPEEAQLLAAFRVLPKERQLIAIKLLEALKLTDN
jgi:transcriptional regulator with XRE-family HTH domain